MPKPWSTEPTFTGSVDDDCPAGFRRLERTTSIDPGDFARARSVVLSWRFLQDAGVRVEATTPRPELGTVIRQHLGPIVAPCRVIEVFDEPTRAGFSYATLPGHPERGVERFSVELQPGGSVWCQIESISQAASWYARLGGPVTRFVQSRMVDRYLRAIAG